MITHNILILDRPMLKCEEDSLRLLSICESNPSFNDMITSGMSILDAIKWKIKIAYIRNEVKRRSGIDSTCVLSWSLEEYHFEGDALSVNDAWLYHIVTDIPRLDKMIIRIKASSKIFPLDTSAFSKMTILSHYKVHSKLDSKDHDRLEYQRLEIKPGYPTKNVKCIKFAEMSTMFDLINLTQVCDIPLRALFKILKNKYPEF